MINNCTNCGYDHEIRNCPAFGRQCRKCNRYNHFEKMCPTKMKVHQTRTRNNRRPRQLDTKEFDSSEDSLFIGTINHGDSNNAEWLQTIAINETDVTFQLDTDAKCNVLSKQIFDQIKGYAQLQGADAPLKSYSDHNIPCIGMTTIQYARDGHTYNLTCYVVDRNVQSVLGAKACTELGYVKRVHTIQSKDLLPDNIEKAYPEFFKGLVSYLDNTQSSWNQMQYQ